MTLSLAKPKINPPRILLYGPEGLGKTTFGTGAYKPVFIPTENGLSAFPEIPQFPQSKTYEQFIGYLTEVASADHDFKTLVIDSIDWLEHLIQDKICRDFNVSTIEDANGGYGKWAVAELDIWKEILKALDYINQEKGMTIILIAHANIKRYEGPDLQGFDRFSIKLQDGKNVSSASLLFEYPDAVFFANYYVGITKDTLPGSTSKKPKERVRGVGSGERVLYTEERPAFRAKNRYGLPEQIPFTKDGAHWNVIAQHIPYFQQQNNQN